MDAILLDAFGTLVRMEPPGPRLAAELSSAGVEVEAARAEAAFRAEIAYYREHHLEGRDERSLDELRDRCAGVLRSALALPDLDRDVVRHALLAAIRFDAFPDAAAALRDLRERGIRLVVVSNWDCTLPHVLEEAGLASLLDAVVPSASVGAAKPDSAIFRAALEAAGSSAERALHVGDSPAEDVGGARAAGIRAVLLERDAERIDTTRADAEAGVEPDVAIAGLGELAALT